MHPTRRHVCDFQLNVVLASLRAADSRRYAVSSASHLRVTGRSRYPLSQFTAMPSSSNLVVLSVKPNLLEWGNSVYRHPDGIAGALHEAAGGVYFWLSAPLEGTVRWCHNLIHRQCNNSDLRSKPLSDSFVLPLACVSFHIVLLVRIHLLTNGILFAALTSPVIGWSAGGAGRDLLPRGLRVAAR